MKLSALEIKSQEFKRVLRGLDEAEVQAFLDMVASQWQEIQDDLRRQEEKVRELESKIVHYRKIEEALQEALTSAKASSRATLAEAERRAELIVEEAQIRARALAREAESNVLSLHESATAIGRRRREIVARLRAFLHEELEMLEEYRERSNDTYIPPVPSDLLDREDPNPPSRSTGATGSRSPSNGAIGEVDITDVAFSGKAVSNRLAYSAATEANENEVSNPADQTEADPSWHAQADEPSPSEYDPIESAHADDAEDADGHEDASSFEISDEMLEEEMERLETESVADPDETARGPVEHQRHTSNDRPFSGESAKAQASSDAEEDDMSPANTEWRIRRILDNLE